MAQKRIKITASPVVMEAELNDSKTAQLLWDALPIEARGTAKRRVGRRNLLFDSCGDGR